MALQWGPFFTLHFTFVAHQLIFRVGGGPTHARGVAQIKLGGPIWHKGMFRFNSNLISLLRTITRFPSYEQSHMFWCYGNEVF